MRFLYTLYGGHRSKKVYFVFCERIPFSASLLCFLCLYCVFCECFVFSASVFVSVSVLCFLRVFSMCILFDLFGPPS